MDRTASQDTYVGVLEDLLAEANLRAARLEAVLRTYEAADQGKANAPEPSEP